MPDEISPLPVVEFARRCGKSCYLPVIRPSGELGFAPCRSPQRMLRHRWGFRQPVGGRFIPLARLDVLVMPLLAFDERGNRLGMGGGYYDRTLRNSRRGKPFRLGMAFEVQQADRLTAMPWDVRLDGVLTPSRLRCFRQERQP